MFGIAVLPFVIAPPAATPSFSRVTPVQHTKSPLQARELEIITLQKQLEALTKEKIKLTLSLCEEQAEADDYKRECEVKIRDLEKVLNQINENTTR